MKIDRSSRYDESVGDNVGEVLQLSDQRLDFAGRIERSDRVMLIADIVESVRLIESDEEGVIPRWLALVRHVETELMSECSGRLVNSVGDGFMLEFNDAREAVSVALAIQHASKRQNFGVPSDQHLLLRIGIEACQVIIKAQDIYGHGVNLAARLASLAGPSEIVISAHVHDRITSGLDADIEDLGNCYLKHIKDPVRAFRVGPPGPRPKIEPGFSLEKLLPTLAVIPFVARRTDPEHDVLGEILAEEIIREVSPSPELNVISRLSTTGFRGRHVSLEKISTHLNADYVVSGVYRVDGQRLTLDIELAETKSEHIVWVHRFTDHIAAILNGQQELIGRIVTEVRATMAAQEVQRTRLQALPTLENYTLLMAGITLMNQTSRQGFEEASKLLEALLDRATRQPVAQAWMANWHVLRVMQGWSPDPEKDAQLALGHTARALNTDPECSLALAIDGAVHTNLLRRLDVALERYQAAIDANPNNSLAWLLRGTLHAFMDNGKQAVEDTQHALMLSPLDPQRHFYLSLAATACLANQRFDDAIDLALQSLRANRFHTSTYRTKAVAEWQLGLEQDARATVQELLQLDPQFTVSRYLQRTPAAPYETGRRWANALRGGGVPN